MSTRATILIKSKRQNEKVRIYHHSDGYPEGVGHDLKEYLKGVKWWDVYDIANELIKGKCGNKDGGYELTPCQHGDEDYDVKKMKQDYIRLTEELLSDYEK